MHLTDDSMPWVYIAVVAKDMNRKALQDLDLAAQQVRKLVTLTDEFGFSADHHHFRGLEP